MKTRSRSTPLKVESTDRPADPIDSIVTPSDDTKAERLTVTLRPDGSIDTDAMRERTRDRFFAAVARTPAAGGSSSSTEPAQLPPIIIPAICQALGSLSTVILMRVTKAPIAIVAPIAAFNEKDQAVIGPPLLAVLNKYLASSIDKYGTEAALILALYSIGQSKLAQIAAAMPQPPAAVTPSPDLPPGVVS